jgi:hypothetical protein
MACNRQPRFKTGISELLHTENKFSISAHGASSAHSWNLTTCASADTNNDSGGVVSFEDIQNGVRYGGEQHGKRQDIFTE